MTVASLTDQVTRRLLCRSAVSVAVGLPLAAQQEPVRRGKNDPFWLGTGLGIVVQGGFLLVFDLWHGLQAGEDA